MTHEDKIVRSIIINIGSINAQNNQHWTEKQIETFGNKLKATLTTYRAQVLEEVKTFHDKQSLNGECAANNEGLSCCVEKYLKHPTN